MQILLLPSLKHLSHASLSLSFLAYDCYNSSPQNVCLDLFTTLIISIVETKRRDFGKLLDY